MGETFLRKLRAFYVYLAQQMEDVGGFVIALNDYVFHKIDQLFWLARTITLKNFRLAERTHFRVVGKLIWAHGRLGYAVKYAFIVTFLWFVYLIGGVFQTSFTTEDTESIFTFVPSSSILFQGASAATYTRVGSHLTEPIKHKVEPGETLLSIGRKYNVTIEAIKFANDMTSNAIKDGEILYIPPVEGTLHKVRKGDTIDSLAIRYGVAKQSIVDFNYIDEPYTLTVGEILIIPNAKENHERFYVGARTYGLSAYGIIPYAKRGVKGTGKFAWPFSGVITQRFHSYHPAVDIANPTGDIYAADKGVVIRAGWWQGGYGNAVQIDHRNGYVTTYAHMSSIAVSVGQEVKKGEKIGVVGSTGRSTGPHVHFSIQKDGKYLNPLSFF